MLLQLPHDSDKGTLLKRIQIALAILSRFRCIRWLEGQALHLKKRIERLELIVRTAGY